MKWRERLAKTQDGTTPNIETIGLAGSWSTCAVGEQRQMHPGLISVELDMPERAPKDEILKSLGNHFYMLISDGQIRDAEMVLDKIEDRVLELKRDEQQFDDEKEEDA